MIDSTSCAAPGLVWAVPDATIALEQASSSLPYGRSLRLEHPILRPAATHPMEPTIYLTRNASVAAMMLADATTRTLRAASGNANESATGSRRRAWLRRASR
jgi:hypothetical protein